MRTDPSRRDSGRVRGVLQVFLILLAVAAAALAASPSELGSRARLRFEVLPLREGVLLKPSHQTDYAVIEVTADGVAIDGEELSSRELRRRLGTDADLVEEIADLDPSDLREVAVGRESSRPEAARTGSGLPAPPAPPAPPAAPDVQAPSAVPAVQGVPAAPQAPSAPAPVVAPTPPRSPRRHADAKVSVASSAHVARGETSDDVFVLGGEVIVDGEVNGDAVAVGGEVKVDGRVSGNVVSVGGDVVLGPNADVDGDVTSVGGQIKRDAAARVGGRSSQVAMGPLLRTGALGRLGRHSRVDFAPFDRIARLFSSGFRLVLMGLFACVLILLARRPLERVADKVADDVWRCGLTGLLSPFLILPLLVITIVVLAVSVIGIPLLVLVPFAILALFFGAFLGYSAVALLIGRWAERRFGWDLRGPYGAVIVGLLALHGLTLLGRALDWDVTPLGFVSGTLLFAGFVLQLIVCFIGFGAVLITRFGTYAVWRNWRFHRPESNPEWPGSPAPGGPAPAAVVSVPPPPPPAAMAEPGTNEELGRDGIEGETKPGT